MSHETRITTCCYCGTRAALVLRGEVRHVLSCSACGAPIRTLKQLPSGRPSPKPQPVAERESFAASQPKKSAKPAPKRKKRRKSTLRWAIEEAWDTIEDIFD